MIKPRFVIAASAAVLLFAADRLLAQPTQLTLDVTAAGGAPAAGLSISTIINGIKGVRGTTNQQGQSTVTVDVPPGTDARILSQTCNGQTTEVAVVVGKHECPEGCNCNREAAIVLSGGEQSVAVKIGGLRWYVLPSFDLFRFSNVEFDSGLTAEDTWSSGGGLYAGIGWGRRAWVGVGGHIINIDREISINGSRATRDYHAYQLGASGRYMFGMGRYSPYGLFGLFYDRNEGDFPAVDLVLSRAPLTGLEPAAAQDQGEENRVHESWRYEFGGGVIYWFAPRFGLDTTLAYSPAVKGEDDADEYIRISIGLTYNGGIICGGQCGGRR